MIHQALHDEETGLPNRRALERDVDASLRAGAPRVVVAALGVDRFQHIRGAIGYGLTTRLMAELGARLSRRVAGARAAQLTTSTLGLIVQPPTRPKPSACWPTWWPSSRRRSCWAATPSTSM